MSSMNPATFAAQFAQIEIQPFKQRYQLQTNTYQSQLSALGKVESAMREFRTALNEMNSSTNSIIKTPPPSLKKATLLQMQTLKALSGSYQIFVEQVATSQVSTGMPADLDATTGNPKTNLEFTINGKTMTIDLSTVDTDGDGVTTVVT